MQWKSVAADACRAAIGDDRGKLDQAADRLAAAASALRKHAQEVREKIAEIGKIEHAVTGWFRGSVPVSRFRAVVLVAVCAAVLSGCMAGVTGGTGGTRDGRIDALGQRVVADLKAQPVVADASFDAIENIDQGKELLVTIAVHADRTDAESTQPLVDLAFKDAWLTPKNGWVTPTSTGKVSIRVHVENTPSGRTIAGDDLQLPPIPQETSDQKDPHSKLTSQYGLYQQ